MFDGFGCHPCLFIPRRGALVKLADGNFRPAPLKARLEQIGEKAMVTVPFTHIIQRDNEKVCPV